jgi:hypothetical protein
MDRATYTAVNWLASDFLRLSAFATACALIGIAIWGGPGL